MYYQSIKMFPNLNLLIIYNMLSIHFKYCTKSSFIKTSVYTTDQVCSFVFFAQIIFHLKTLAFRIAQSHKQCFYFSRQIVIFPLPTPYYPSRPGPILTRVVMVLVGQVHPELSGSGGVEGGRAMKTKHLEKYNTY